MPITPEAEDITTDQFLQGLYDGDVIADGTGQYTVFPRVTRGVFLPPYEREVDRLQALQDEYQENFDNAQSFQAGGDKQRWGRELSLNLPLLKAAQETLEQKQVEASENDTKLLRYFRAKAVQNGWTVSDTNNYILRNGQDIVNSFDYMFYRDGSLNEDQFNFDFVNNPDASKNFANIDPSPRLSLNQFKNILIKDNGLSEAEYYAALGPSLGATREEQDTNIKAYYLDAVRDPNNLDAFGNPVVGVKAADPTVTYFVDNIINTEAEVIAAYKKSLVVTTFLQTKR